MTDAEIIAVVTAHKEGKQIQYRNSGCSWEDWTPLNDWCFCGRDYRVKPEPRNPREWQVTVVNGEIGATGYTITNTDPIVEHIIVREVIEE